MFDVLRGDIHSSTPTGGDDDVMRYSDDHSTKCHRLAEQRLKQQRQQQSLLETFGGSEERDDDDDDDEQRHGLAVVAPRPTRLFTAIQKKEWDQVVLFLRTGRWRSASSYFRNDFAHLRDPHRRDQCRTWTIDPTDGVSLRLPLHAAVLAGAPAIVIERLLELYDDAIRCVDSSNLLPLELAMLVDGHHTSTSDASFLTLLEAWPPALTKAMNNESVFMQMKSTKNQKTLLPLPLSQLLPHPKNGEDTNVRYQYLRMVVEQSELGAKTEIDDKWRQIVTAAGVKVTADDDLDTILTSLLNDRRRLQEQQRQRIAAAPAAAKITRASVWGWLASRR